MLCTLNLVMHARGPDCVPQLQGGDPDGEVMEAMGQLADWRAEQEARREALTDALATETRRRAEAEAHVAEISAYNSAILEQSQVRWCLWAGYSREIILREQTFQGI